MVLEAESGSLNSASVIADNSASGGSYLQFNQSSSGGACPAGQVGTPPNCLPANQVLGVNAGSVIRPFDKKIKGISLANWTFGRNWGKPFVGQVQGLRQAVQAIDPGIIRYAGGLWANYVGFDRNRTQLTPYTEWSSGGQTYYFNYGTDELADLDAFAKSVNADVMIQVNVSNNNPAMWADLVRYAQERGFTSFKYYELGNELDLEVFNGNSSGISSQVYAQRVAAYQTAMLAVNPGIKIVGGVPAAATDVFRTSFQGGGNQISQYITLGLPASRTAGRDWDAASIHWYQTSDSVSPEDVFHWSWNIPPSSQDWWRVSYSRDWSGKVGPWIRSNVLNNYPSTQLGISELGVNSSDNITTNANHIAALWYSDVLGRFAYSGIDWITQWNSYAAEGEYFSLLYPNNDQTTTPTIHARPSYYAYLMYQAYFGDQLVESSSFNEGNISIWASRDSDDPGKLKLRITNLTGSAITTPIALNGFTASGGQAYTLASTNPLDQSSTSARSAAPTTINGAKINAMNVAGSLAAIQPTPVTANGTSFSYTVPAYSSVAIVLGGSF